MSGDLGRAFFEAKAMREGSKETAEWLQAQLEEMFEVISSIIGRGAGEAREGRILNRITREPDVVGNVKLTSGTQLS